MSKREHQLHCPRFHELPLIDLYAQQVLDYVNEKLWLFVQPPIGKVLTKTMMNNYVKSGILPAPVKKKYSREALMVILLIVMLKELYAMDEIAVLIRLIGNHGYDCFAECLEAQYNALRTAQPLCTKDAISGLCASLAGMIHTKYLITETGKRGSAA